MGQTNPIRRRVPRQERGEARVTELLKAAEAVFEKLGYEAATMTAIAECACASIGAIYQYFPDKAALAEALRQRYAIQWESLWIALEKEAGALDDDAFASRMVALVTAFFEDYPAYLPLTDAPRAPKSAVAKAKRREQLAALIKKRKPRISAADALRMASVIVQVLKGMRNFYIEVSPAERGAWLNEYRRLLTTYLRNRTE
jgi:AcrR family transcriptional regulator